MSSIAVFFLRRVSAIVVIFHCVLLTGCSKEPVHDAANGSAAGPQGAHSAAEAVMRPSLPSTERSIEPIVVTSVQHVPEVPAQTVARDDVQPDFTNKVESVNMEGSLTTEMIREILLKREVNSDFEPALLRFASEIPELPVAVNDAAAKWQTVQIAEAPSLLDGQIQSIILFKFRSPLDGPADLHWAFAVPDGPRGEWNIVAAKGEVQGLKDYKTDRTLNVIDSSLPLGGLYITQELKGGRILPGEEYIAWYVPPDSFEKQIQVALKLTAAGTYARGESAAAILQTMGMAAKKVEFAQTTAGLRSAFEMAHRLVRYESSNTDAIAELLRSVWDQLPTIEVGTNSEKSRWNRLIPDLSFRFQAFRFKSSLNDPADLDWCHVSGNGQLHWGFVSRDEDMFNSDDFGIELNLPIPEIANPETNVAVFQHLSVPKNQSGHEYVIWFTPSKGALPDIDVMLRLSASETAIESPERQPEPDRHENNDGLDRQGKNDRVDVKAIGQVLGIEIPAIPSPQRVAAALDQCQRLVMEGRVDSRQFLKLMQFATPGLPDLKVDPESGHWTKIELNQNGQSMVAFRIGADLNSKAQILSIVARPPSMYSQLHQLYVRNRQPGRSQPIMQTERGLNWGPVHRDQSGIHSPHRRNQTEITMLGPSIPANSTIDFDTYPEWDFEKDGPYVIVFSPVTNEPMEVHLAVRIASTENGPKPTWQNPYVSAPTDVIAALELMGLRQGDPINPGVIAGRHESSITALRFADEETVVTGSLEGTVMFWDVNDSKEPASVSTNEGTMFVKCFSQDGSRLVAVDHDSIQAVVHDSRTFENKIRLDLPGRQLPNSFCFSPDGQFLVASSNGNAAGNNQKAENSRIVVWNLSEGGKPKARQISKGIPVDAVCWLPDGRIASVGSQGPSTANFLLSALSDKGISPEYPVCTGQLRFLNAASIESEHEVTEEGPDWQDITLSADGTRLGTVAQLGWLTTWDAKTGHVLASVPTGGIGQNLSLSKDGRRAVVTNFEGEMQIWDLELMRVLTCGKGRMPLTYHAQLSPGGDRIAVGDADRYIRLYHIDAAGPTDEKATPSLETTDSTGMQLNRVPAGQFTMGHSESGYSRLPQAQIETNPRILAQKPRHVVHVTKPFFMGRYEVTVAQFRQFVLATGYRTTAETSGKGGSHIRVNNGDFQDDPELNWTNPGFPQKDDHPVVQVSYLDANEFCKWLSKKESSKYRLPTEAEWEYACRAGTTSAYYHGSGALAFRCSNFPDIELIKAYGKFDGALGNSDGHAFTSPVGSYVPNGFGLYDMHGNVWEWCADWYVDKYYEVSPTNDPIGPEQGNDRVQRGGSFLAGPSESAWRDFGPPDQTQSALGFRVVREIP